MAAWRHQLDWDPDVILYVDFQVSGRTVVDYSIALVVEDDEGLRTVRVYDAAHGFNELHRYTSAGGKQQAELAHAGTLGEGMRSAIDTIRRGYRQMIEGWRQ
jgi:hypothetical protein